MEDDGGEKRGKIDPEMKNLRKITAEEDKIEKMKKELREKQYKYLGNEDLHALIGTIHGGDRRKAKAIYREGDQNDDI